VSLERIVADARQFNPNPAARSDVGRLEIRRRLLLDHRGLETLAHGKPHGEMTILVMVVGKHREHTFVLLDEERRRPVREPFCHARQRGAESPHPLELRVPTSLAGALPFVTRSELLGAEPGDAFDQIHRDGIRKRKPDSAFAELVARKLVLERRD